MRLPWATLLLAAVMLSVYLWSSEGSLYPSNASTTRFAFGFPNPGAILFHLFFHVGLIHFLGNLVPLLLFALLVEYALCSKDVFLIFISSGLIAGFIFSLLNPSVLLVGASAGVSGLMAAAAVTSPKKGLVLLILTPVIVSLAVVPLAASISDSVVKDFMQEKHVLEQKAEVLQAQNQSAQAEAVRNQAATAGENANKIVEGKQREKDTPTDFLVHAIGAAMGFSFVALLRRKQFYDGLDELDDLFQVIKRRIRPAELKNPALSRPKKKRRTNP